MNASTALLKALRDKEKQTIIEEKASSFLDEMSIDSESLMMSFCEVLKESWQKSIAISATSEMKNSSQEETDLLNAFELLDSKVEEKTSNETLLNPEMNNNSEETNSLEETRFFLTNEKRYELVETLGEGGMGVVQLVHDKLLGRKVALKKIKMKASKNSSLTKEQESLLWRLSKEASITAILEHPNIVPLYEMQQKKEGELQFTMRKVEGETLRALIQKMRKKEEPFEESRLLSIFSKVCEAVSYAHAQGVIHRDLKPDNIMVGEFGEVYVMDWGIAKQENQKNDLKAELVEYLTLSSAQNYSTIGALGTPGYMSPEQVEDAASVTEQADVYSLGKILRECFTLQSPLEEFQERIDQDLAKMFSAKKQDRQEKICSGEKFPLDILAIERKATHSSVEERYQTVEELLKDLQRYQKNVRISVRDYSLLELFGKWLKRNKEKVFVLILLLAVVLLSLLWRFQENRISFQLAFQQFEKADLKAQKIHSKSKLEKGKKIQLLVQALNHLNHALVYQPNEANVETKKRDLGERLIYLCCETQDYQLARYVANELQFLKTLGMQEKQSFQKFVDKEQTKTLKKHKERLHYWMKELKNPDEGIQEVALLEISKMPEQEIFEILVKELQKGKKYFLEKKQSRVKRGEYYQIMAKALGQLENPEAGKPLLDVLVALKNKLSKLPPNERSIEDINYMTVISQALVYLKDFNATESLRLIRREMGLKSLFSKKTRLAYQMMADNLILHYDREIQQNGGWNTYFKRGKAKDSKGDFQGAIEDFELALLKLPKNPYLYFSCSNSKVELGDLDGALTDVNHAIALNEKEAIFYNNRGVIYKRKEQLEAALADFNKANSLAPKDSSILNNRGLVKYQQKKFNEALQDCNLALALSPYNIEAYLNRALVKKAQQNFGGALADLDQALLLDSQYLQAYSNRGLLKFELGNLDGSLYDFNTIISINPNLPIVYLNRGTTKKAKGDFNGALLDYQEALRLEPDNFKAYYNIALVELEQKRFGQAIESFNKALALNASDAGIYNARGVAKERKKELKEALLDYQNAIRLKSDYEEAYFNIGEIEFKLKNYPAALKNFNEAIRLKPVFWQAHHSRGLTLAEIGEFEKALFAYQQAIQLKPNSPEVYANRGYTYTQLNLFAKALTDLNKAIEIDPKYSAAYNKRGHLFSLQKNFKAAVKNFETAIKYAPQDPKAYMNLGAIYYDQKQFEKALPLFEKVLLLTPTNAKAYHNRGTIRFNEGELQAAQNDFTQALHYNPALVQTFENRGKLFYQLGKRLEALQDYSNAIRLNPRNVYNYLYRGAIKEEENQLEEALLDYNKALQLSPDFIKAYNARGRLQAKRGNFTQAIEDFTQAIKLAPKFANAYTNRGNVYLQIENYKAALLDYKSALKADPKNAQAYSNIATIQKIQGEFEAAILNGKKAIHLNPEQADFYFNLGTIYLETNETDLVLLYLEQGLEIQKHPQIAALFSELVFKRMVQQYRSKKFERAKKDLFRFQKYAPSQDPKLLQVDKIRKQIETEQKKQE